MQASDQSFETAFQEPDEQADDMRAQQRAALQELVASRVRRAVDARLTSGIEDIWQEDDEQYNGLEWDDTPANQVPNAKSQAPRATARPAPQRSRIYVNITKPKTDTGVARVQELLVPHDDKPWAIEPTPVPEVDAAIEAQDQTPVMTADGGQVPRADAARALAANLLKRAEKMAKHIDDWFVEGKVLAQWRRVIRDAGRIGTGVLKGPFPTIRTDRKWQGGKVTKVERLAPTSKAISAWDFFPDPSCGENIHEGAFVVERDYMTGRTVRGLAKLPDYDATAIAEILKEGPRSGGRYDDRYQREKRGQTTTFDSETFETFYYYGDIPPATLVAGGWTIAGLIDGETDEELQQQVATALELATVPVVVTVINERIVRICTNPLETGEFPFDLFVWEAVEGQPWGRGIPRQMAAAQKMLNAATRAMLENAGMSAGPQVLIHRELIEPANGRYEITGRKLWFMKPRGGTDDVPIDGRFLFQVVNVPSAQKELQGIIQYALEMADQLTNLPLMMQGDMGAAPDTVGGMAMLEANAVSPLKVKATHYDDCIVVPHLSRYYSWGMQDPTVPDDAKGDMQVKARGASALITRDIYAQILPQLFPMVKDPAFKLDPEKFIEQLLRSNKIDPQALQLTTEQVQAQQQAMAENPPVDPKVEAANILASQRRQQHESELADRQAQREFDAAEAAADRQLQAMLADIEFQVQAMEFAGQKEISFEQLRAMLATKAMDIKNKREMFAAERQFAETAGDGRGL